MPLASGLLSTPVGAGNATAPLTLADLDTAGEEPRILDIRLAEVLGFADLVMIRKLIRRHEKALVRFGLVSSTVYGTLKDKGNSSSGGRPGKAYWLTKKQALYICTKSETPNATEATIQMVEVFDAWLAGRLPPVEPEKPVAVKAHRRALPHTPPELAGRPNGRYLIDFMDGKIDRLVDVGISQVVDPASASSVAWFLRERVTQDVIPTALEVAARRARPDIPRDAEVKAVPAPFSPGSNLLLDLRSAMRSARVRMDRGEAPSILEALESVFHDFNERNEGRRTSGAILDWNWNRASGTYSRETGKPVHPVLVR